MSKKGLSTINIILLVVAAFVVGALIYYFHEGSDVSAYLPVNGSSSTVATSGEPISPGTVFQAPPATTTPSTTVITATLTPKTGGVGTAVTIHGSGFASTGNMVTMNGLVNGSLDNLPSADGNTIKFTIPSNLGPNCNPDQACPQYLIVVTNNTYNIAVISNGVTQNIGVFIVDDNPTQVP
jgi:hypothetical protein